MPVEAGWKAEDCAEVCVLNLLVHPTDVGGASCGGVLNAALTEKAPVPPQTLRFAPDGLMGHHSTPLSALALVSFQVKNSGSQIGVVLLDGTCHAAANDQDFLGFA